MQRFMQWLQRLAAAINAAVAGAVKFVREVLSENGVGSLSRCASASLVAALVIVMLRTGNVPEHTEELAWVIAALYGANQIKNLGSAIARARESQAQSYAYPNTTGGDMPNPVPTGPLPLR